VPIPLLFPVGSLILLNLLSTKLQKRNAERSFTSVFLFFSFFFFFPPFISFFFLEKATCYDPDILASPISTAAFASKTCPILQCVYQKERCPTTLRIHYQMAFKFENTPCLSVLRRKFPSFYWAYMIKEFEISCAYCSKISSRVEGPWQILDGEHTAYVAPPSSDAPAPSVNQGAPSTDASLPQKKHNKLLEVSKLILKKSMSIKEMSACYPVEFIRNGNGIDKFIGLHAKHRDTKTHVTVIHGMTGCGKSTYVMDYAVDKFGIDDTFIYDSLGSAKQEWWEGYIGQRCVIIEEMVPGKFSYDRLLRLFDRYPVVVPFKGGSRRFSPEVILVTSNFAPSSWFPEIALDKFAALQRRIDLCFKVIIKLIDGVVVRNSAGRIDYQWLMDVDNMCPPHDNPFYDEWLTKLHKDNDYFVDLPPPVSPDLDMVLFPDVSDSRFHFDDLSRMSVEDMVLFNSVADMAVDEEMKDVSDFRDLDFF